MKKTLVVFSLFTAAFIPSSFAQINVELLMTSVHAGHSLEIQHHVKVEHGIQYLDSKYHFENNTLFVEACYALGEESGWTTFNNKTEIKPIPLSGIYNLVFTAKTYEIPDGVTATCSSSDEILGQPINTQNSYSHFTFVGTDIAIHSNPTSNQVLVYGVLPEHSTFSLFDMSGRWIMTKTLDDQFWPRAIDLSDLPSGQYIGSILHWSGQKIVTQKIQILH